MKTKTLSPAKKKAASATRKKTLSAPKSRPASAVKKKTADAAKKKPLSLAALKRELHQQVADFVAAAFKGKRRRTAFFVLDSERTNEGAYILCFAVEDEPGYYKLDWSWHCSYVKAQAETALMNKKLGLNEEDVNKLIISTMGPPARKKK